ncbi:MAG: hypothetical protein QOJ90_3011 [Actinomycetota bacterium]|jgi:GNAT superfamily N-acetyltransferase|nr:hypothetical protein [Actinomycetota bacterium]
MTEVRLGSDSDIEAATAVFAAAAEARRGTPVPAEQLERVTERLASGGFLLLATDLGTPIGMAAAFPARDDEGAGPVIPGLCHLGMVFVAPQHWGRMVGRALVEAVLAEARARGFERIQLYTHEDNSRGQALYGGRGFARTGFTKDDEGGERVALWARAL